MNSWGVVRGQYGKSILGMKIVLAFWHWLLHNWVMRSYKRNSLPLGRNILAPLRLYSPAEVRTDARGYRYIKGTIAEHVNEVELVLGYRLPVGAQVHHVDYNPGNNKHSNLVVCPNASYHTLLHKRTDALNACGNANWEKCRRCKGYDDPAQLVKKMWKGDRTVYYHKDCNDAMV